ncbi:hypothetical protein U879_03575 [Defluviimonas sp. 20V17]|uniref:Uncharacterized protein n=1 Tax=Allgaiera indica TaxID=765699 RepID=A0AAN4UUG9_9RHOB|nr:hypothetical protein [Allgaiera indica]KDB05051.1 hypothetical protein U879_03575 [Defluviimonas sp. 20V17]GHE05549.1 hypothetical protein GCM10008024_36840 [Allgaiera indica]SDX69654.1 hypothetical protein SAMN05444006_1256 [Allgaiera indica]
MTNDTTPKTIPTLFTEWRELSRKLAIGAFAPEDFDRTNDERIEVENAIAKTAPRSLEELAQKCIIAGGSDDVEVLPSTFLANDAMALLGVGGPIEWMFDEWIAANENLWGKTGAQEHECALRIIDDLERQILAAPSQSSLDVFRKLLVLADGAPDTDDDSKGAVLIREAYAALGLPLRTIGTPAAPQMAE